MLKISDARKAAAVHPQLVILPLDVDISSATAEIPIRTLPPPAQAFGPEKKQKEARCDKAKSHYLVLPARPVARGFPP